MRRRVILIVYMAALFLLAVTPPVPAPLTPGGFGLKLHHVAAFFVFTLLAWYAYGTGADRKTLLRAVLHSFAVGVAIEAVQVFIPYRTGRWQDLISNAAGIALALPVIAAVRTHKRRRAGRVPRRGGEGP